MAYSSMEVYLIHLSCDAEGANTAAESVASLQTMHRIMLRMTFVESAGIGLLAGIGLGNWRAGAFAGVICLCGVCTSILLFLHFQERQMKELLPSADGFVEAPVDAKK